MGVSAVFVSALALTRLPVPSNPPANQAQLLAAMIQPIVSFVVLGSIIVRMYCFYLSCGNRSVILHHRWSLHPAVQLGKRGPLSHSRPWGNSSRLGIILRSPSRKQYRCFHCYRHRCRMWNGIPSENHESRCSGGRGGGDRHQQGLIPVVEPHKSISVMGRVASQAT
jgi:hypothetical protein